MTVGQALTFSRARMDSLRGAMDARYAAHLPKDVYRSSIAYGDTVARHILAWAGTDRYKESRGYPKYSVSQEPGRWIPTPPAYMDAVEPHWGTLRPFVMDSGSQFAPPPPFRLRQRDLFAVHARGARGARRTARPHRRRRRRSSPSGTAIRM